MTTTGNDVDVMIIMSYWRCQAGYKIKVQKAQFNFQTLFASIVYIDAAGDSLNQSYKKGSLS